MVKPNQSWSISKTKVFGAGRTINKVLKIENLEMSKLGTRKSASVWRH